jgi:hypothetical protein
MVGRRRKVALGDLEIFEHDHSRDLVDLRACGGEYDPKVSLRSGWLDRDGGTEIDLAASHLLICGW